MNNKMNKIKYLFLAVVAALSVVGCDDPWKEINEGAWNHEHSIIAIEFEGQAGLTEITSQDDEEGHKGTIDFKLLSSNVPDMSKVAIKTLTLSYGATATVAKGETLDFTGEAPTIAVTSPNGDTRVYTLNMTEFTETLIGTYKIQKHMHYGGTGPEYGGGALMDPQEKSWVWNQKGFGPNAEYDNYFEITFETVNAAGNSVGTCVHYAGVDGKFWNCIFLAKFNKEGATDIDLHKYYRLLPMGTSKWERNYSDGTITFTDAAGKKTVATLMEEGSHFIFKSNGTTDKFLEVPNFAFNFAVAGVDDWTNIYGDYDKFVKKARNHYILFEPVESIPEASKTEGTEGDITIAPPPEPVALPTPKVTLGKMTHESFMFSWETVENASGYKFTVTTGDQVVKEGDLKAEEVQTIVSGLTAETVYNLAMKATGDNMLYLDSDWTEFSFTTPEETVVKETLSGTYKIGTRWVFTGIDPSNTHVWNYNDKGQYLLDSSRGYEKDNILVLKSTGTEGGLEVGEADYQPGPDGNYWKYLMKSSSSATTYDMDCGNIYNKLPHGKSTYKYDENAGTITFTTASGSIEAKWLKPGDHEYQHNGGKVNTFTHTSTMALDFKITRETDDWNHAYDNLGWVYYGVNNYIMEFNKQ